MERGLVGGADAHRLTARGLLACVPASPPTFPPPCPRDRNFTCWENSTALPFVMALAELERLSVGFPRSARVYLYVRGGLKYQPLQDGFPILVPFTSIRASNPPFFDGNGPVTVQRSTSARCAFHASACACYAHLACWRPCTLLAA